MSGSFNLFNYDSMLALGVVQIYYYYYIVIVIIIFTTECVIYAFATFTKKCATNSNIRLSSENLLGLL